MRGVTSRRAREAASRPAGLRFFGLPWTPPELPSTRIQSLDGILNMAKDAVRESEVMSCPPDAHVAEIAALLREGVARIDDAVEGLQEHRSDATTSADAAIKSVRHIERVYRQAMAGLLELDDLREVTARRELYRRFSRLGDVLAEVAERVWYAVIKEA